MANDKLVDSSQLDSDLTSIANAIRTKGGTSASLNFPADFVQAIGDIQTGAATQALSVTQNGTYTAPAGTAYTPVTVNVTGEIVEKDVVFIDYDGKTVASKTKAEINAMTSDSDLPANPSHTGLTAQGWNWTVAQLKAQLLATPTQKIYVGQMYITESRATEIDIELVDDLALSPYLNLAVNGSVTIDWGDNSATDTVTGSSTTSRKYTQHVYSTTGNYTISITVNSGKFKFYVTASYPILTDKNSSSQYSSKKYASSIKKIRLGENVASSSVFRDHYSIESITIPYGITSITNYAFSGCYSLKKITIPSSVTSIETYAFSYCCSLTGITIPYSATSIASYAFNGCYSITKITIPSSVTSIAASAFSGCYSLESITIPSSVTSIAASVFYNCFSITKITIPSGVTSIGNYAFYQCYSITSVTISSSVTSIGEYAFNGCYSITKITIPSSVTSIAASAFASCYSLTSVTIPSSVTSIAASAFNNCYSMLAYHFERTTPPTLGTTAFSNIASDCIIYVPYSADHSVLNAYKGATNWSTYASYMQEEPQ